MRVAPTRLDKLPKEVPVMMIGMLGWPAHIAKTREIFKVQVSIDANGRVLVYNRERSHAGEFEGPGAKECCQTYGLSRFGKTKTYVFGAAVPERGALELEDDGELPPDQYPDW